MCVQVTSRLQEASHADVNDSVGMSAEVDEMKQLLTARILTLELLVSYLWNVVLLVVFKML